MANTGTTKGNVKEAGEISILSAIGGVLSAIFTTTAKSIIEGTTKPLISDSVAEIISDKDKAKKFDEFLNNPNEREYRTVAKSGEVITYKK